MIGFYDSGIGGLTILNSVLNKEPRLDTFYFADSKNCPLGEKTPEQIKKHVTEGVQYLFENGCDLVVLACNTATAVVIRHLQQDWIPNNYPGKNVLGVVRPVVLELIEEEIRTTDSVVILATKATVNTKFYTEDLAKYNFQNVTEISMENLAIAIENKDSNLAHTIIDAVFSKNQKILSKAKAVVLACTHYPYEIEYIRQSLSKYNKNQPLVLSQNEIVCQQLIKYLDKHKQFSEYNDQHQFFINQ
ncbi:MAG: glutamate racemase [Patescibacteria group bacterium]